MYKTILTCLTSIRSAETLTEAGAYLAEKSGGHLIGVHNSTEPESAEVEAEEAGSEAAAVPKEQLPQRAEAIRRIFERVAASRRLSFEWRHKTLPEPKGVADMAAQGLSADLIVAGGGNGRHRLGNWYDLPVHLAMDTARPVLLIPAEGRYASIGRHVTVAWNRSRESSRAVFAALPLLRTAECVRLVAINGAASGALGPGDHMPQTLTRHDIKVKSVAVDGAASPAEALMTDLTESRSDLLVMGCFGRPRLLEMVLGGVTRHILSSIEVPVLLAH